MKKLAELKKRLGELKAEGKKILAAVEAAGDTWTDEQEERFSAIEEELDEINAYIETA
mgnify:FL=1